MLHAKTQLNCNIIIMWKIIILQTKYKKLHTQAYKKNIKKIKN